MELSGSCVLLISAQICQLSLRWDCGVGCVVPHWGKMLTADTAGRTAAVASSLQGPERWCTSCPSVRSCHQPPDQAVRLMHAGELLACIHCHHLDLQHTLHALTCRERESRSAFCSRTTREQLVFSFVFGVWTGCSLIACSRHASHRPQRGFQITTDSFTCRGRGS